VKVFSPFSLSFSFSSFLPSFFPSFFLLSFVVVSVFMGFFETRSLYAAQADLKLVILLLLPP
jgi:hypothetical protein